MGEVLTNQHTVGWYGIIGSGTLLLIATWRLTAHLWGWCPGVINRAAEGPRAEGWTMRRAFHLLLFIAMFLETLGYAEFIGLPLAASDEMSEKVGYGLLEIFGRCNFEFGAYSVATSLWFLTIKSSRAGQGIDSLSNDHFYQHGVCRKFYCLPATIVVAFLGLSIHSIIVFASLYNSDYDTLHDWKENSHLHKVHLVAEGCWWTIHGILVLFCAWLMYQRLLALPSYQDLAVTVKTNIVTRMLVTILTCAACYIVRGGMIILARVSLSDDDDDDFENGGKWWIIAMWVPTLFPSILLLYAFRRIERGPSWIDGVSLETQEVLGDPKPPQLIWQEFKRILYDSNDEVSESSPFDYETYNTDFEDSEIIKPATERKKSNGSNSLISFSFPADESLFQSSQF